MIFKSEELKTSLFNVCKAYSIYNPSIGYTQGMNFIAGALLFMMEEINAFLMFSFIIDKYIAPLVANYMEGVLLDQDVLKELIRERMPDFYEHMQRLDYDVSMFVTGWFTAMFMDSFAFSTVMRLWDIIICRGATFMVIIVFAVLKLFEKGLIKCKSVDQVGAFLKSSCKSLHNWDKLVQLIEFSSEIPSEHEIMQLRAKWKRKSNTEIL